MSNKIFLSVLILLIAVSCSNKKGTHITDKLSFSVGFDFQHNFSGVFFDREINAELIYFAEPVSKKVIKIFDLNGNLIETISLKPIDYLTD